MGLCASSPPPPDERSTAAPGGSDAARPSARTKRRSVADAARQAVEQTVSRRDERRRSKRLDVINRRDHEKGQELVKVLVLGIDRAGKTAVFNHMRAAYTPDGESERWRASLRSMVRRACVEHVQRLARASLGEEELFRSGSFVLTVDDAGGRGPAAEREDALGPYGTASRDDGGSVGAAAARSVGSGGDDAETAVEGAADGGREEVDAAYGDSRADDRTAGAEPGGGLVAEDGAAAEAQGVTSADEAPVNGVAGADAASDPGSGADDGAEAEAADGQSVAPSHSTVAAAAPGSTSGGEAASAEPEGAENDGAENDAAENDADVTPTRRISALQPAEETALRAALALGADADADTDAAATALETLSRAWAVPEVQRRRAAEAQSEHENVARVVDEMAAVFAADYLPPVRHVVSVSAPLAGTDVARLKVSKQPYEMYDVGGGKAEQRKWVHHFDIVTAIIFVASLAEYDRFDCEDGLMTNRLVASINAFAAVCQNPHFAETPVLLLLNKHDVFMSKVRSGNHPFRQDPVPGSLIPNGYFQDYEGDDSDADAILEYITAQFLLASGGHSLIHRDVCVATAPTLPERVVSHVGDIVLGKTLREAGF